MGITLVGQIIFATGVLCNMYWMMVMGRFIFGYERLALYILILLSQFFFITISIRIGAESLAVAQNNYAVLWFKGKELNMVFGLQLSFARIGSAVNFLVIESIYEWVHRQYQGAEALGIVLYIGY